MNIRGYRFPTLLGSLGTLCLALAPSCDGDPSTTDAGGGGGEGGETGGAATSTGGSATGGKPAVDEGGNGGEGGAPLTCETDEWLDEEAYECIACADSAAYVHVCEDFTDETSSPDTVWDAETQTLTLQLKPGLPPIQSATFYMGWYGYDTGDGSDYPEYNDSIPVSVTDGFLKLDFSSLLGPVIMTGETLLTVTDTCGNTSVVDNLWQYESGENYLITCE